MSRFANPARTGTFTFAGGCACPGSPHDDDHMELRTELGATEMAMLEAFAALGAGGGIKTVAMLLVSWNLLDDDGDPAPPNEEWVGRLWSDQFSDDLNGWIDEHVRMASLPNASGGRSANGSSATASRTPGKHKRRTSTTSS